MLQDKFEILENEKLQKQIKHLSDAKKRTANWSDKVEATKYGISAIDKGYIGHKSAKMMKRSKSIEHRQIASVEEKSKLLKNIDKTPKLSICPMEYHTDQLLDIKDVSLFYGENKVCSDVSFTINQGDRIALRGKNGCGKSTILKFILKEKIEYTGTFHLASNLIISYVPQDTSFLNGTIKKLAQENAVDQSLLKSILIHLDFSRTHLEKKLKTLSTGHKKKVLIAKSLCEQAHLYIWDEPLNFIDVISRMQIENLICEFKPIMLFIQHDSNFTDKIATQTIDL